LEKWVAGAGAVIAAATFIIGIVASADARTFEEENIGVLTQKIKQYEIEKNMTQPEDVIKNALKEWELWQQ
jgi:hypothetical protein